MIGSAVAVPNGVPPPPEPVEVESAKHLGLTWEQVEANELRIDANRTHTKWQPLDQVKNLVWIKQNTIYSVALEDWDRMVQLITERVDRMEKRSGDLRNEVYQLVGFFSVFQGVVLTAVTQMTQSSNYQSTCKKVWSPVILTGLAWIATILAVWQKLTRIHEIDERSEDEDTTRRVRIVYTRYPSFRFSILSPASREIEGCLQAHL